MSTERPEEKPQIAPPEKTYIGDSVYVQFDGYNTILTTENGYPDDPSNRIALEPAVWDALKRWMVRLDEFRADWFRSNA